MASWIEKTARYDYCACVTTCLCSFKSKVCYACITKIWHNVVVPYLQSLIEEENEK